MNEYCKNLDHKNGIFVFKQKAIKLRSTLKLDCEASMISIPMYKQVFRNFQLSPRYEFIKLKLLGYSISLPT